MLTNVPPAEPPIAAMNERSMANSPACARSQRTAALRSYTEAGSGRQRQAGTTPERRRSRAAPVATRRGVPSSGPRPAIRPRARGSPRLHHAAGLAVDVQRQVSAGRPAIGDILAGRQARGHHAGDAGRLGMRVAQPFHHRVDRERWGGFTTRGNGACQTEDRSRIFTVTGMPFSGPASGLVQDGCSCGDWAQGRQSLAGKTPGWAGLTGSLPQNADLLLGRRAPRIHWPRLGPGTSRLHQRAPQDIACGKSGAAQTWSCLVPPGFPIWRSPWGWPPSWHPEPAPNRSAPPADSPSSWRPPPAATKSIPASRTGRLPENSTGPHPGSRRTRGPTGWALYQEISFAEDGAGPENSRASGFTMRGRSRSSRSPRGPRSGVLRRRFPGSRRFRGLHHFSYGERMFSPAVFHPGEKRNALAAL